MKRLLMTLTLVMLLGFGAIAQKAEVLYFKANLACCQAKACASLEKEVQSVIAKNFSNDKVAFTEVKLADESNKKLIEKHNAKSQTVVMVITRKKKETVVDLTDIVRRYSRNGDKVALEKELVAKMKEGLK